MVMIYRACREPVTFSCGCRSNEVKAVEAALEARVREEELKYSRKRQGEGSLWHHLLRVARLAENLGRSEGLDPVTCRLAGLFHDAGKFCGGTYHQDDRPEEERSVDLLLELAGKHGLSRDIVDQIVISLQQLYREGEDQAALTRVLFDADNLDKLGFLGITNYFIKTGLRGNGVSADLLYRLTVELTYARHAAACMATSAGYQLAQRKAPETYQFILNFLQSLRDDGIFDFKVEQVMFDQLPLDVVSPYSCECSGDLQRRLWKVAGIKCIEIHLEHSCPKCESRHEIRFCTPKLRNQRAMNVMDVFPKPQDVVAGQATYRFF